MKMRNKGKVHPFTSSSSSSTAQNDVIFPVLNLLPAAIFALISVLSLEDREVLAYMFSRSLKSAANPPLIFPSEDKRKNSNGKQPKDCHKSPALFDCECFHCYTSFWFRWDSSPNRELIHQAIEAFEEHLNNGEQSGKGGNSKNKKREKMGRRKIDSVSGGVGGGGGVVEPPEVDSTEKKECLVTVQLEGEVDDVEEGCGGEDVEQVVEVITEMAETVVEDPLATTAMRGLARKVLPDVMGIFNSRLWRLWSPNV